MRAVRLHNFGGELGVEDIDEPSPGPDEVLIDVAFAAVEPLNIWVALGRVDPTLALPLTLGVAGAGHVTETGDADSTGGLRVGQPVAVFGGGLGMQRDGLYAQQAAVPASAVVEISDSVDLAQAATLGVVGVTAWRVVRHVAEVTPDDRVLVLGASGGVGCLAVQLAKGLGATVWGQTSNEEKAAWVAELGADEVVVADGGSLADKVADLHPTVVCDPLGGDFTMAAIRALEPFGRIVVYGASGGDTAELQVRAFYRKAVSILSYSGMTEPPQRVTEGLREVLNEVESGRLHVPIDATLSLEQADEAHQRILERRVRGKLVLQP